LQTDASGAEDTTSYTHNHARDVTSIQDAEDAGARYIGGISQVKRRYYFGQHAAA
jgi:hypothetical protein